MDSPQFDPETHAYSIGGRRLISVTQALQILDDRWKIDPFYLERGRIIHLATEFFDRDELDEATVDPQIAGYVEAYKKFRSDTDFAPRWIEARLYHPQYLYAGQMDRTGEINGFRAILDIKSGVKSVIDSLQLAAYWELCRINDVPVKKCFDLYLSQDGTYKLEHVENPRSLLPYFLACLKIQEWRQLNGIH